MDTVTDSTPNDAAPNNSAVTDYAAPDYAPNDAAPAAMRVQELSKIYASRPALDKVTLEVNAGEVYALVGPNGAGKTTLIRLLTGLAFPSSGTVRLLGKNPIQDREVKALLGAVVEAPAAFYPYLTGRQNLRLHARLSGLRDEARLSEVLQLVELSNAAERKVRGYSLGMRQRLGVAAALLNRPKVLILDEPTSGMDPLSLHLVHSVLQDAAKAGAAVLISTHHLEEVNTYCDKVAILEEGRLLEEINLRNQPIRYCFEVDNPSRAVAFLKQRPYSRLVYLREGKVLLEFKGLAADTAETQSLEKEYIGYAIRELLESDVAIMSVNRELFDLRAYYAQQVGDYRVATSSSPATPPTSQSKGAH